MSFPRIGASRITRSVLRESRIGSSQPFQRRYATNGAGDTPTAYLKYLTRPEGIAAVVVTIPIGWYFLRESPAGGKTPDRRPAQGGLATPEDYHPQVSSNPRLGDEEQAMGERKEFLGTEQNTGNYRASESAAEIKRGKKHDNPMAQELLGEKPSRGNPAKHSVPIDQDKTKSKKSTGEPETAKAQSTVTLDRR